VSIRSSERVRVIGSIPSLRETLCLQEVLSLRGDEGNGNRLEGSMEEHLVLVGSHSL